MEKLKVIGRRHYEISIVIITNVPTRYSCRVTTSLLPSSSFVLFLLERLLCWLQSNLCVHNTLSFNLLPPPTSYLLPPTSYLLPPTFHFPSPFSLLTSLVTHLPSPISHPYTLFSANPFLFLYVIHTLHTY